MQATQTAQEQAAMFAESGDKSKAGPFSHGFREPWFVKTLKHPGVSRVLKVLISSDSEDTRIPPAFQHPET